MSKIKTIELFSFNELSVEAQNKVIEKNYDINVDDGEWAEWVIEDFNTQLELIGFHNIKTYYSGFSSQGDGASFEANYCYIKNGYKRLTGYSPVDVDFLFLAKELQELQKNNFFRITADIRQNGLYYHSNTMYINSMYRDNTEYYFLSICKQFADILYKRLRESYYYLTSKEAIIDTLLANEYYFTMDGELE